jgi:dynein heavy chain
MFSQGIHGQQAHTRYFAVGNGDRLLIAANVHIVFECAPSDFVSSVATQLPTSRAVSFEADVVGWDCLATTWLDTRRPLELKILKRLFDRYMPEVSHFVHTEVEPVVCVSVVGQVQTLTALLHSFLQESVEKGEILPETHIECIFLFSLAWSFGGNLTLDHRRLMHKLLKKLSPQLVPQDKETHTIFDYFLSSQADWLGWDAEGLDEMIGAIPNTANGPNTFISTPSSRCLRCLTQHVLNGGRNLIAVGNHGVGKSTALNEFAKNKETYVNVQKFVCSRGTEPESLRDFMARNTQQRNGNVYGVRSHSFV